MMNKTAVSISWILLFCKDGRRHMQIVTWNETCGYCVFRISVSDEGSPSKLSGFLVAARGPGESESGPHYRQVLVGQLRGLGESSAGLVPNLWQTCGFSWSWCSYSTNVEVCYRDQVMES